MKMVEERERAVALWVVLAVWNADTGGCIWFSGGRGVLCSAIGIKIPSLLTFLQEVFCRRDSECCRH